MALRKRKVVADPGVGIGSSQPVALTNLISTAVTVGLAFAAAFGLHLSDTQQASVISLAAILIQIAATLYSRSKVTPVAAPKNNAGIPLVPVEEAHSVSMRSKPIKPADL